jgi:2-oxoglutarate ferredoxin oxidoreductase subunit gamma
MIKILLAGEGGQGIQTVAKVLTEAAQMSGQKTSYIPSFGVEQRGGVSLAYVQISDSEIPYPRFEQADIVVVFCDRAIPVIEHFLTDKTLFIYDSSAIHDKNLNQIREKVNNYLAVEAQKIAREKYSTKVLNMLMLGALSTQFKNIPAAKIEEALAKTLGDKLNDQKIKELNFNAIAEGIKAAENFDSKNSPLQGTEMKEIQCEYSDDKKTWTRFPQYCKGCSLCIVRCPVKALQFSDEVGFLGNPLPVVDINKCIACGMCEKTCPDGAVKIEKK